MANIWQQFEDVLPNDKPPSEDRIIMLSDGVFAIAMTLLVLDIQFPSGPGSFQANLHAFLYKILFYFITFRVIAGYWLTHHRIMHQIRRMDKYFIWLTFLFLAFVALFPATISIVNGPGDHPEAVIIYGLSFAACGFSASFLWIYATWRHRLIDPDMDQRFIFFRTIHLLMDPLYFLLSLLLLFIPFFFNAPPLLFFSWILIGIPPRIVHHLYYRRPDRKHQRANMPVLDKVEPPEGNADFDDALLSTPSAEDQTAVKETSIAEEQAGAES